MILPRPTDDNQLARPRVLAGAAGRLCGIEAMAPVDGGEVWADDTGGTGPALVLLHPGIGDSTIWDGVLPALDPGARVIRYDVRGYGRSPAATKPYAMLADLIAVLDHFALDRVVLVGCSMGGATSLQLALAEPDRVASLLLLCPGIPVIRGRPTRT